MKQYLRCTCGEIDDVKYCAKCRDRVRSRTRSKLWRLNNPGKYKAKKIREAVRSQQKRQVLRANDLFKRKKLNEYTLPQLQDLPAEKWPLAMARIVGGTK